MKRNIEIGKEVDNLFRKVANGEAEAYAFLCSFDEYFEDVTAFVVSDKKTATDFVALLARTNTVYSLPYFTRHGHFLHLPIQQAFNALADGLAWKESPDAWRKQWGKICSLAIVDVILAVAHLKLGFSDARKISPEVRELAWAGKA